MASRRSKRLLKYFSLFVALIVVAGCGVYYYWKSHSEATCTNDCNVLLISVDSMRADHMGAYGYKRNTTPNFDMLTQRGTLFKNYFSPSYITPVSEGAVQTGLYPSSTGIKSFFTVIPKDRKILPQYMQSLGYYTQSIIASPEFTEYTPIKTGFSKGYDKYDVHEDQDKQHIAESVTRQYPDIKVVRDALATDSNTGKKKFTWLALGGVHWPFGEGQPNYFAVTGYNGPLSGRPLDLRLFANIYDGVLYHNKDGIDPIQTDIKLDNSDYNYVKDKYDNGVYAFDSYLGQVIAQLKELKQDKKTIIIIESEHAEELGEHGYFSHYDILDNQVHVPLLVIDPRVKGGKKIDSVTTSVDVLPTIFDMLGTSEKGLQGKSLLPLMTGKEKDNQRDAIYLERVPLWEEGVLQTRLGLGLKPQDPSAPLHEDIAIRTPKWKYIDRQSHDVLTELSWWKHLSGLPLQFPAVELYDLQKDPGETKNVAKDNPKVVAELSKKLAQWHKKVLANQPTKVQSGEQVQPYQ